MPLVSRPGTGWQAYQMLLPGTPTGGPRSALARGWPTELPDSATLQANLPRHVAQPGTRPTGRGRPTPQQLGLGPGTAPTGEPSMGNGRASIFMTSVY